MNELALSVDCGTQSLRALLFDSEGHLLDGERVRVHSSCIPPKVIMIS